ncbi:4Fe-4S ferredoxin iron-sulfur binding domain protein [Syntrophobotulus glycolicus DSM 8271]|uniref:4Fe-4S ferredoxin iron-sulfur binding domain protein n=1 Tax=Syntrophobotulus glycolicus (strain DSM 8271 / FlGlyR) TaxID=645991 RepID=F0SYL3_SYNGF|nr:4Fe-4S binding protein [Syntrophobotulus glycolicus]ADY57125.1 4Fe-4S ferredoxin iron-sulfur binding domain protein [Syntrophobotulus glycolicus DSM 8271]
MPSVKKLVHKWIWTVLLSFCLIGLIYPVIGLIAIICMSAPIIVALFKGRMWCGSFCPRGSFNDTILAKFSHGKALPSFLKSRLFRNLFFILLMGAFALQLILAWGNITHIGLVFVRMVIVTTLIAIVLGISFNQRTWCRICPMGTIARYASQTTILKIKPHHITFQKQGCTNCKICSKSCVMGIDVLTYKNAGKVTDADCLKCRVCVDRCPKKSLYIA